MQSCLGTEEKRGLLGWHFSLPKGPCFAQRGGDSATLKSRPQEVRDEGFYFSLKALMFPNKNIKDPELPLKLHKAVDFRKNKGLRVGMEAGGP